MNRISEFESLLYDFGRKAARAGAAGLLPVAALWCATFGTVVPIDKGVGGHVSDIVLDESRGVLYVANFTAKRIDVVSTATRQVTRFIQIPAQPAALALSPDGQRLVVVHFLGDSTFPLFPPTPPQGCGGISGITVINPSTSETETSVCLSDIPLGIAFGSDDRALILTTRQLLSFEPVSGSLAVMGSVDLTRALPDALGASPGQIIQAAVAASQDLFTIYGMVVSDSVVQRFRYDVREKFVTWLPAGSSPGPGPVAVSVNRDGSRFMAGFGLFDRQGNVVAQYRTPLGQVGAGTSIFDSAGHAGYRYDVPVGQAGGTIFAQIPDTRLSAARPYLTVFDADNLTIRDRIPLPENLVGKSVFNASRSVMYSASESGVVVLPVGSINRVVASKEDLVFRSNVCGTGMVTQEVELTSTGGAGRPFAAVATMAGVTVTPSVGTTPARVRVSVDLSAFKYERGSVVAALEIFTPDSVHVADGASLTGAEAVVRIVINNREADYRGTFVSVPGTLVDILADPVRDRLYLLRQGKNDVQVFDSRNYSLIATLRTSSTPTQMTLTTDRQHLLVGHDDSQFAYVYDLETLRPAFPDRHILFPVGHHPKSIAAAVNGILVSASGAPEALNTTGHDSSVIDAVDFLNRRGWVVPDLGSYQNCTTSTGPCPYDTWLTTSADGGRIFGAASDGTVMLWTNHLYRVTASRRDFGALAGAFAVSGAPADLSFVVGNNLLNSSLVPVGVLNPVNPSSGALFLGSTAYWTTGLPNLLPPEPDSRTECVFGGTICVTQFFPSAEPARFPPGGVAPGAIQTLSSVGGVQSEPILVGGIKPVRLVESPLTGSLALSVGQLGPGLLTRTLASLRDNLTLVSLSTSGFIVVPRNYDAPAPAPRLDRVVSTADQREALAPGSLISLIGRNLPTALGDACLTVNGFAAPLLQAVSSTQVNGQLPFNVSGNAQVTLKSQGGVSDTLNITIEPAAPSVFRALEGGEATVFRADNNSLVSSSNPVRGGDHLVIYATGLGRTSPAVTAGEPSPGDPLAVAVMEPVVTLGGAPLQVVWAGLTPGGVGVYQINVRAPQGLSPGQSVPLTISQGGATATVPVQVANQ